MGFMDEQTWSPGGDSLDENHEGGLDGGHGGEGEERLRRSGRNQQGSEVLGSSPHPNRSVGCSGEKEVVLRLGRWGCLLCQARPPPDTPFFLRSHCSRRSRAQSLSRVHSGLGVGAGGALETPALSDEEFGAGL